MTRHQGPHPAPLSPGDISGWAEVLLELPHPGERRSGRWRYRVRKTCCGEEVELTRAQILAAADNSGSVRCVMCYRRERAAAKPKALPSWKETRPSAAPRIGRVSREVAEGVAARRAATEERLARIAQGLSPTPRPAISRPFQDHPRSITEVLERAARRRASASAAPP